MREFLTALEFLTRIPTGKREDYSPQLAGSAVAWYPVVGLVIGLVLAIVAYTLFGLLGLPPSITAVLVLAIWVGITGALHLDGLGDCADALMGGRTPEHRLQIMKDTACGTGAVTAVALLLLLKFTAIQSILEQEAWVLLLVPPLVARIVLGYFIAAVPYIRENGLGCGLQSNLDVRQMVLISGLSTIIVVVIAAEIFLVCIAAGALAYLVVLWMISRRIGGATGDAYGALVEIAEALLLIGMAAVMTI